MRISQDGEISEDGRLCFLDLSRFVRRYLNDFRSYTHSLSIHSTTRYSFLSFLIVDKCYPEAVGYLGSATEMFRLTIKGSIRQLQIFNNLEKSWFYVWHEIRNARRRQLDAKDWIFIEPTPHNSEELLLTIFNFSRLMLVG